MLIDQGLIWSMELSDKKGISLTKKEMKSYEEKIKRAVKLPKWDVTIEPAFG